MCGTRSSSSPPPSPAANFTTSGRRRFVTMGGQQFGARRQGGNLPRPPLRELRDLRAESDAARCSHPAVGDAGVAAASAAEREYGLLKRRRPSAVSFQRLLDDNAARFFCAPVPTFMDL